MIYNKKEFAEQCGISTRELSVYISRKKVIVDGNDNIDNSVPANHAFMEKQLVKKLAKPEKLAKKKVMAPQSVEEPKNLENEEISRQNTTPQPNAKFDEKWNLDMEKQRQAIQKLQREGRLAEMEFEKRMGKLIPTDLVKSTFIQTIKSYTMAFKQAADKISIDYGARNKLSRNDLAELRATIISAINRASEDAMLEGEKSIKNIVSEYSQLKV